ncbi:MAG TPA: hypothetical protein VFP44_23115, partial [Usitatibacter sp.]|nr:hypothetical protein [Usitatibacter sp.]
LLNLPPNPSSREAQELIGVARERRGEPAKARAEYELFLKLHPTGADADRVRKRLATLGTAAPAATPAAVAPSAPRAQVWGSVAQGYYGGKSHSDTQLTTITPATNATTIDTQSLSATEQSEILTTVDLNARYSVGAWDNRLVFRDTHGLSFLSGQPNGNRLVAAYGESRHVPTQSLVRVGRQYSTFGGILGRFDGVIAGTGIGQGARVSVVGGRPADLIGDLKPSFYGLLLELDSPALRWSGNAYGILQRLDGRTDRRAAGGEVRYFDAERSLLASADYDVSFRTLNVGTMQGTWQVRPGTMLNVLGDYRRTPSLQLSNALLTGRNLTLAQLIETFGETQARDDARAVTPISKVAYAGVTQQLGPRWQVGADVRISSLSSVPEVGLLPAAPGTGTIYTYSAQLIGNALWGLNDVAVLNLSALTGASRTGFSAGFTQRMQLRERWILEPSLRYYRQHDDVGVRLTRWSPGIKFAYRLRDHVQLEAEWTMDRAHTAGPVIDDNTTRHFFFLGYRWDF